MRLVERERADRFRYFAAKTPEDVVTALLQLADIVTQYGQSALSGDPTTFALLAQQREAMAETLERDSLARQIRPKAEAAFKRGAYAEAAELYERMRLSLSATELKKLEVAKKRAGR